MCPANFCEYTQARSSLLIYEQFAACSWLGVGVCEPVYQCQFFGLRRIYMFFYCLCTQMLLCHLLDFRYTSITSSFIPAMHSGGLLYLGTVLGVVESSNIGEQKMLVNVWTS